MPKYIKFQRDREQIYCRLGVCCGYICPPLSPHYLLICLYIVALDTLNQSTILFGFTPTLYSIFINTLLIGLTLVLERDVISLTSCYWFNLTFFPFLAKFAFKILSPLASFISPWFSQSHKSSYRLTK